MLEDRLGEYLIEPALGWDASLSAMWQTGRRVVLAYNYPLGGLNTSFAWPGVSHQWADTTSMDDLHSYLREAMTRYTYLPVTNWYANTAYSTPLCAGYWRKPPFVQTRPINTC